MAELLILAFDTHHPDPAMDRLAWKRGHVVAVKPDGWTWGREEHLPKFFRVRVPDLTMEEAQAYLEAIIVPVPEGVEVSGLRGVRRWRFDADDPAMPMPLRNALRRDEVVSSTWASMVPHMRRAPDGG